MPEDNERSIKARRISHLRKQMRKRATVSSGDTSGKPGSGSAEQPGWQRQLSAIRQSLRANTELGAATVDQETIRKSQDEALDALEALAERQRSEEQERRLFMHQMLDYVEAAEQHTISDEDVEQALAQLPEDNYILAEDFTAWNETIYADLHGAAARASDAGGTATERRGKSWAGLQRAHRHSVSTPGFLQGGNRWYTS